MRVRSAAPSQLRAVSAAGDRVEVRRFNWDRAGLALILSAGLVGGYVLAVTSIGG